MHSFAGDIHVVWTPPTYPGMAFYSDEFAVKSRNRRGFALLITVTLLAFLVLLLVSLASLTRVETQVADNTQKVSVARQQALMALTIAIGELQRYAGPDQRVTAPADLVAQNDVSGAVLPTAPAANGGVQPSSRHWTGVWGNGAADIGYGLRPDQIHGRGVASLQLNWLVSGNEGTTYVQAANGRVSAVTAQRFSPALAVSGLTAASTVDGVLAFPVADASTGESATRGVLMVGPGSVSDGTTAGRIASFAADDYVVAPIVTVRAPAGVVPGRGAGAVTVGRYAWWIGDEGTKARVNLRNGYQQTEKVADRVNSFVVAQRAAPEFMIREVAGAASPTAMGAAYPFGDARLAALIEPGQLGLIDNALVNVPRHRFHDLTTRSQGVLSDTYAGGLKKDLTADIADTSTLADYRPADTAPIFTPRGADEANLPTWGHLRSWARATPVVNPLTGIGELAPAPPTTTQAGIAPVMVYAAVGLDLYIDHDNVVHVALVPAVLLSNPYPVTMTAARYDLGFRFPAGTMCRLDTAAPVDSGGSLSWQTQAVLDLGNWAVVPGNPAASTLTVSSSLSFVIDAQAIPPGETHLYRLDGGVSGAVYTPGRRLTRAPEDPLMARGLTNHVLLPTTLTLPDATDDEYYFRVKRINVANAGNNTTRMETILAAENGLNDTTKRYQFFNMITGQNPRTDMVQWLAEYSRGSIPAPPPPAPPDLRDADARPDNASSMQIGPRWRKSGVTEVRSSFRVGFPMEAQSAGTYGMPQFTRHWLRHGNFRAPMVIPTRYETTDALLGANKYDNRGGTMLAGSSLPNRTDGSRDVVMHPVTRGYATSIAGENGSLDAPASEVKPLYRAIFFDVPDTPDHLLSLGQLQHVPFSRHVFSPLYPVGNSMADLRVPRTTTYVDGIVERDPGVATTALDPAYDLSWHLNRALWDRYFVSGVPAGLTQAGLDTGKPLPNARMTPVHRDGHAPELADVKKTATANNPAYDRAAANLLVAGAFNINSTSEQAWRAVLGGTLGVPADTAYAHATADKVEQIVPYPRFARGLKFPASGPWAAIDSTMTLNNTDAHTTRGTFYHGNRGLWLNTPKASTNTSASAVINELARTLVNEIRRNGPFLSLADFVNRPVLATKETRGIKGALQAAIDTMSPTAAQANPLTGVTSRIGTSTTRYLMWDSEHFYGGPLDEETKAFAGEANTDSYADRKAFGPKYLTQADVLSTLGPQLAARSDTFRIRTYGENVNPATQETDGRVWCEAVVQRLPDYVDGAQRPEEAAAGINLTFGRRFQIVSFRWLAPSEI